MPAQTTCHWSIVSKTKPYLPLVVYCIISNFCVRPNYNVIIASSAQNKIHSWRVMERRITLLVVVAATGDCSHRQQSGRGMASNEGLHLAYE